MAKDQLSIRDEKYLFGATAHNICLDENGIPYNPNIPESRISRKNNPNPDMQRYAKEVARGHEDP